MHRKARSLCLPDRTSAKLQYELLGSLPRPVLTVVGLKAFHTMVSQILVAMKREMPEPKPYPFCRSSSKSRTIKPATKSCESKKEIKEPKWMLLLPMDVTLFLSN